MDLTAGSIPKAGILMQSSGTGLVYKSTRRRAASWGFISEILTIDELFTIVMVSEMLWLDYGHLYIVLIVQKG